MQIEISEENVAFLRNAHAMMRERSECGDEYFLGAYRAYATVLKLLGIRS